MPEPKPKKKKTRSKAPIRKEGFTQATAERILDLIIEGRTVTSICEQDWAPNIRMWFRWVNEDRWGLSGRYQEAKRLGADIIAMRRMDALEEASNAYGVYRDAQENQRADTSLLKLQTDCEREWRRRVNPEAWANRQVVQTQDSEDGPLQPMNVFAVPVKKLDGPGASKPNGSATKEKKSE